MTIPKTTVNDGCLCIKKRNAGYLDGFPCHNAAIGRGLDDYLKQLLAQLLFHGRHQLTSHILCLAPTPRNEQLGKYNDNVCGMSCFDSAIEDEKADGS